MQTCNYRIKAILGAFWCACGIVMILITLFVAVTGHTSLWDALKGLFLGLLFAGAGAVIARHYWV